MIAGFLYGQFAGLAPAARFPKLSYEGLVTSLAFDGPTRVRTSVAAIVIAAMMPAVLTTVLSITLASLLPGFVELYELRFQSRHRRGVAGAAVPDLPGCDHPAVGDPRAVPSSHCEGTASSSRVGIRRGRRADGRDMRLLVSPMVPLLSGSPLTMVAAAYGAIMGALYRRFAGLEPVPLPEAVIATDPNALVGADDPARHQHRVILSN